MSDEKFRVETENMVMKLNERIDNLEKDKLNLEFFDVINEKRRKQIDELEKKVDKLMDEHKFLLEGNDES